VECAVLRVQEDMLCFFPGKLVTKVTSPSASLRF
jgi:hypothetical protein